MGVITLLAAVGALTGPVRHAPLVPGGNGDELIVHAVRFYRGVGDSETRTAVKAFVQVPYLHLRPAGDMATFTVSVVVRDSAGTALTQDAWPAQHVRAELCQPGAYSVNMMEFQVLPGSYDLEVVVTDSVSGTVMTASAPITGFARPPRVSDLLLSPSIRPTGGDSTPSGGEWRSGNVMVASAAQLHLTPLRANLFYLLEVYTDSLTAGTISLDVVDSTGRVLLNRPPRPMQLAAGGGVLMGQVDLEGLPEGTYTLKTHLSLPSGTAEQAATFTMAGLQETVARAAEMREASRSSDAGYFAGRTDEELKALAEPLEYIAGSGEMKPFDGLSVQARRDFLAAFWARRNPDTSGRTNPARDGFYSAIDYANAAFREPGRNSRPGWKTERGEVWARYGKPDEELERVRSGIAPTYEVWRYTNGRARYFVFADRTGLGHYSLLTSNDLQFRGVMDWRDRLGEDAVRDIGQFLSVDFYQSARPDF